MKERMLVIISIKGGIEEKAQLHFFTFLGVD